MFSFVIFLDKLISFAGACPMCWLSFKSDGFVSIIEGNKLAHSLSGSEAAVSSFFPNTPLLLFLNQIRNIVNLVFSKYVKHSLSTKVGNVSGKYSRQTRSIQQGRFRSSRRLQYIGIMPKCWQSLLVCTISGPNSVEVGKAASSVVQQSICSSTDNAQQSSLTGRCLTLN